MNVSRAVDNSNMYQIWTVSLSTLRGKATNIAWHGSRAQSIPGFIVLRGCLFKYGHSTLATSTKYGGCRPWRQFTINRGIQSDHAAPAVQGWAACCVVRPSWGIIFSWPTLAARRSNSATWTRSWTIGTQWRWRTLSSSAKSTPLHRTTYSMEQRPTWENNSCSPNNEKINFSNENE
jgi:hypothetical protein